MVGTLPDPVDRRPVEAPSAGRVAVPLATLSSSFSRRWRSICSINDGESGAKTADVTDALCAEKIKAYIYVLTRSCCVYLLLLPSNHCDRAGLMRILRNRDVFAIYRCTDSPIH